MSVRSFALALAVCAVALPAQAEKASWYKMGHKTASGMPFSVQISATNPYIAAHKTLRFGTRVLITNLKNMRTQCVSVQDRGPYVGGVSYDLTHAAAVNLGFIGDGHARIKAEVASCYIPSWALPAPKVHHAIAHRPKRK